MMSRRIGVISQKGGSGKTTLVLHLAVAAVQDKENVLVLDTDPQGSAQAFAAARPHQKPVIQGITVSRMNLEQHKGLTMIDTAPHAAPDAVAIARQVDLVLIPCRPSVLDLAAMGGTVDLVIASGTPSMIVLSACPFRAPETAQMRAMLQDYGIPIAKTEITDRRAYQRAISCGLAVTEFEKDGKAAAEIRALWKEVKKQLRATP